MPTHHSLIPEIILPIPSSLFHYHFPTSLLRERDWRDTLPSPSKRDESTLAGEYDAQSIAFVDALNGASHTRGEAKSLSLRLGAGLTKRFATSASTTTPADRQRVILIFSPNTRHYPIIFLGCQSVLYITSPANAGYTSTELAHQLQDSGAEGAFVHPDLVQTFLDALKVLGGKRAIDPDVIRRHTWLAIPDEEVTASQREMMDAAGIGFRGYDSAMIPAQDLGSFEGTYIEAGGEHEVALLCYSSGTTGLAKGVMTTHHNLTSAHATTRAVELDLSPTARDTTLAVLPFYHIYGLVVALLQPFSRGVPVIILPRFIPDLFLRTIVNYKITFACVVPPIVVFLANDPMVDGFDLSGMRGTMSAAAPLGDGLVRKAVGRTKVKITQAYGLTETSPLTHVLAMEESLDHLGSVGKLLPNLRARIVDPGGADVPDGMPGELIIKGPTVMKGYWENEAATRGTFTPDGWFKTGDVAQVDRDGYYFIVDRLKELIKYKGFQVPPADLEAILLTHPKVADVAVIGVYLEEQATEVPKAYIVPIGGTDNVDSEAFSTEIVNWIASKVSNHKKLRGGVSLIGAIPKSAAGKILRRQLRLLSQNDQAAYQKGQAKL